MNSKINKQEIIINKILKIISQKIMKKTITNIRINLIKDKRICKVIYQI